MAKQRMQPTHYSGEIWDGPAIHADLWRLLLEKDLLIEITYGKAPFQIVLGVPHHAAPGIDQIAEDWVNPRSGKRGRVADESTGLTGLAVFSALREQAISCKLVIAAHATDHDPNKTPGSAYWNSIFAGPLPGLLFELHGAANHRKHDLELSAGRNTLADPLSFARILIRYLRSDWLLAAQTQPGSDAARIFRLGSREEGKLRNPALETDSLMYAEEQDIPALHLEMKSFLRQQDPAFPNSPRPSPHAWILAHALAKTVRAMEYPSGIYIPGTDLGLPTTAYLSGPSPAYEDSFFAAIAEQPSKDENIFGMIDRLYLWTREDFEGFIEGWDQVYEDAPPPQENIEPEEKIEVLWLIDQGEFIGRAYFFHHLTEYHHSVDGQVDYWIRPSKRRMGYGRLILSLLLERFRQLGLSRVLISCNSDNAASRRIIEANGGVFESEISDPFSRSGLRWRYWIDL